MEKMRSIHPSVKSRLKGKTNFSDVYDEISPFDAVSKSTDPLMNPLFIPTAHQFVSGLKKIATISNIPFENLEPLIESKFVQSIPNRPNTTKIDAKVSPFYYLYQWGGIELINALHVDNRIHAGNNIYVAKLAPKAINTLLMSTWREDKEIDVSDIFLSFINGRKVWSWIDIPLKSWAAVIQNDRTLPIALNQDIEKATFDEREDMAGELAHIYYALEVMPKPQRWAWALLLFKTCYYQRINNSFQLESDALFIRQWAEFAKKYSFYEASRFLTIGKIDAKVAEQMLLNNIDFELNRAIILDATQGQA